MQMQRRDLGPKAIEAVILDWAGTTMDFGCMAPVVAFQRAFELAGVPISVHEARAPMGAHKRVHIQGICELATVRERWIATHGSAPSEDDVQRMYEAFVPAQLACLSDFSQLIPGTLDLIAKLRDKAVKIGSTTGYTTEMMAINLADAAAQGYQPDATVCANDVPQARPYPYMCFENAVRLGVSDVRACVKIDDTLPGIAEGRCAGMWTIGLAISGNEIGLPRGEWEALPANEQTELRARAYGRMRAAGADFVVDSIAEVWPCIETIAAELAAGIDAQAAE